MGCANEQWPWSSKESLNTSTTGIKEVPVGSYVQMNSRPPTYIYIYICKCCSVTVTSCRHHRAGVKWKKQWMGTNIYIATANGQESEVSEAGVGGGCDDSGVFLQALSLLRSMSACVLFFFFKHQEPLPPPPHLPGFPTWQRNQSNKIE